MKNLSSLLSAYLIDDKNFISSEIESIIVSIE
jgi:hypothetical protein